MKMRSTVLTLTLGLTAGLFACHDQNVVAPDADQLSPEGQVEALNKKPPPPAASVALAGIFEADPTPGATWQIKKEILSIYPEQESILIETNLPDWTDAEWDDYLAGCRESPEGADVTHLITALKGGLSGTGATIRVDMTSLDPVTPAVENRLFVFNLKYPVRYFWVGSWYETGDETVTDAIVTDFVNGPDAITYTLSGGAIGLRDTEGPKTVRKVHCPNLWDVYVTLTK